MRSLHPVARSEASGAIKPSNSLAPDENMFFSSAVATITGIAARFLGAKRIGGAGLLLVWYAFVACMTWHGPGSTSDFRAFYSAGTLARITPSQLYNQQAQLAVQRDLEGVTDNLKLLFVQPPFAALFYMPLTIVSYRAAYIFFVLFSAALLIPCLYRFGLKILLFLPVFACLAQAQLSIFVVLTFLLAWNKLEKGNDI